MSEQRSDVFDGMSLGYRLYMSVSQYVIDIDGSRLPSWWDISKHEKAAWESYAIKEVMEIAEADPKAFLQSTLKVMGLDD